MTGPEDGSPRPEAEDAATPVHYASPDLEAELQAERDFENGDYIELTLEQLEHCAKTGESPWPDESLG